MSIRTHSAPRPRRPRAARAASGGVALVALSLCACAASAAAQGARPAARGPFELRPFVGAYIPTGEQRDVLRDAVHVGAQASYRLTRQLAVTGTFGWSPSKDRISAENESVDVFHYDVGVEGRAPSWLRGRAWDFTPFVGLGLGGRTYDYGERDVDALSRFAGYGALGAEFGVGRVGVRFEARDYLSRFTPSARRRDEDTRNDVTVAVGLTVRF
jgi:hypothetical protein